ncbi:hypothetical protein VTO42DRAFT_7028 [Malbranchea cinnamomea]
MSTFASRLAYIFLKAEDLLIESLFGLVRKIGPVVLHRQELHMTGLYGFRLGLTHFSCSLKQCRCLLPLAVLKNKSQSVNLARKGPGYFARGCSVIRYTQTTRTCFTNSIIDLSKFCELPMWYRPYGKRRSKRMYRTHKSHMRVINHTTTDGQSRPICASAFGSSSGLKWLESASMVSAMQQHSTVHNEMLNYNPEGQTGVD